MEIKEMADKSRETWRFNPKSSYTEQDAELLYLGLAIGGEAGELQNLIKKMIRRKYHTDGHSDDKLAEGIPHELIDILYYVFRMSDLMKIDLDKAFEEKMKINKERYVK